MLSILRRRQRAILWVVLAIIIVTFVGLWGVPRLGQGIGPAAQKDIAGSFGGRQVTESELAYAVRGARISLRLMGYPADLLNTQSDELRMEGWRRLVLLHEADKEGIVVSPDEVVQAIRSVVFRGQDNFSMDAYRAAVTSLAGPMPLKEFEDHIATLLRIQRMQQLIGSTLFVTDAELRQAYDIDHTLIRLAYVPFYYTNYVAPQEISTNELEEFYQTNREDFKVPPKVALVYTLARTDAGGVNVTDEDLEDYYEENKELFLATNAAADAAQTALPDDEFLPLAAVKGLIWTNLTTQRAMEMARDRAEQVYLALSGTRERETDKKIAAFTLAARDKELPAVTTGLLTLEDELPGVTNSLAILRAAFGMQAGDVNDVLEVPGTGFITFMVTDKRDAYVPELDEIAGEVTAEVKRRRAIASAQETANMLKQKLGEPVTNFVAALSALGYSPKVTTPLDRATPIEEIGCPAGIVARLFAFPENVPVVAPFRDGYMLAAIVEIIPSDPELMYTVEDTLREQLLSREQNVMLASWLSQAARDLKINPRSAPLSDENESSGPVPMQ